ncbi:MAG TPA: hypothetical protein VI504_16610 [Candidatus Eisenbacteria bacterium]
MLEKSYPPLGTPVSGFVAFGAPVWEGGHARAVLKLGYDDRMSRNEFATAVAYDGEYAFKDRQSLRTQSVWLPLHLVIENRAHLLLEFGPEWRYVLRAEHAEYRADGSASTTRTSYTEALHRNMLAVSAGLGFEWPGLGGHPRVALRWIEELVTNWKGLGMPYQSHAAQLALGWRR